MLPVNTKVNAVLNQLPKESQQPVISISTGEDIGSMIIGFTSSDLPTNKLTDYLIRVVQPKLQAVEGVQTAEIFGKQEFALRAWLDPDRMAAHGLTATDVSRALVANDFISALGRTQGQMVTVNLRRPRALGGGVPSLAVKSVDGPSCGGRRRNITLGADSFDAAVLRRQSCSWASGGAEREPQVVDGVRRSGASAPQGSGPHRLRRLDYNSPSMRSSRPGRLCSS